MYHILKENKMDPNEKTKKETDLKVTETKLLDNKELELDKIKEEDASRGPKEEKADELEN